MTIPYQKKELRRAMKARRAALSEAERTVAAQCLVQNLAKLAMPFSCVAVHLARGNEVSLDSFITALLARGTSVAAPFYESGAAPCFVRLNRMKDLTKGAFGLRMPPDSPRVELQALEAVFLPGLAFDKSGARLGYGGGWYDRVCPDLKPGCVLIGVGYDCQMIDEVPCEAHDVRMNFVVTPSRIYDCF